MRRGMGISTASGLRPLTARELASLGGLRSPKEARISAGTIEGQPFELVVDGESCMQLHLLDGTEITTYICTADFPGRLAESFIDLVNAGCGLATLTLNHGLTLLESMH